MTATARLAARIDRVIQHYGFSDPLRKAWRGRVVRLDELTEAERTAIGAAPRPLERCRSVHLTWRCHGCRQWTMNGAYLRRRCNFCDAVRPPSGLDPWSVQ